MNLRQIFYFYFYGTRDQKATLEALNRLLFSAGDEGEKRDINSLIKLVSEYEEPSSYSFFFMDFCLEVDRIRIDRLSVSVADALKVTLNSYGQMDLEDGE